MASRRPGWQIYWFLYDHQQSQTYTNRRRSGYDYPLYRPADDDDVAGNFSSKPSTWGLTGSQTVYAESRIRYYNSSSGELLVKGYRPGELLWLRMERAVYDEKRIKTARSPAKVETDCGAQQANALHGFISEAPR